MQVEQELYMFRTMLPPNEAVEGKVGSGKTCRPPGNG